MVRSKAEKKVIHQIDYAGHPTLAFDELLELYGPNVILNLDIDYFFDCGEYVRDAYWSDEKIDKVAELLKTAMESGNVQVLTIAMSPECCSEDGKSNGKPSYQPSWGIMERLLRILTDNAKKEFITIMQEKTDINKNSQINENKN